MEERQNRQDLLLTILNAREPAARLLTVDVDVGVRERCRLGQTRGAAGELQSRYVVRLYVRWREGGTVGHDFFVGGHAGTRDALHKILAAQQREQNGLQTRQRAGKRTDDQVLQRTTIGAGLLEDRTNVRVHSLQVGRDDGLHTRLLGQLLNLIGRIGRVEVHDDAAELQDGVVEHREVDAVRQEQTHTVTLRHAHLLQTRSRLVDQRIGLREGQAVAQKFHVRAIAKLGDSIVPKLGQRAVCDIHVPIQEARIGVEPRVLR